MIPKSHLLFTTRFKLQFPTKEEIPEVLSATRFEGFNEGMMWEPPSSPEELIAPLIRNSKSWDIGEAFIFSIIKKGTTILSGRIVSRKTDIDNNWNVGFWTHPAFQKQGVMTEALAAVLKFGFEELGANKIEACHAIWNVASEKVLKYNGMEFECYIEHGFQKKGKWVDENKLSISRKDWKDGASIISN